MALKFKEGDKVRITGGYVSQIGMVGKVVMANEQLFHPYDVDVPNTNGPWIMSENELELVNED